jgi:hypothetical protein
MAFEADFQRDIIAKAMADPNYRIQAARIVQPDHFTGLELEWTWKQVVRLPAGESYSAKLIAVQIRAEFSGDPEKAKNHLKAARDLLTRKVTHARASLEQLRKFASYSALSGGIESAIKKMERGDVDGATEALHVAARHRPTGTYESADWIEGIDARMAARKARREDPSSYYRVTTGLSRLDALLGGGLIPGDLALFCGLTGVGKSHAAINGSYASAIRGRNTLLVDTENGLDMMFDRLDAKFMGAASDRVAIYDLTKGELDRLASKLARVKMKLAQKLKVVHMSPRTATIVTLEQALDDMAVEGRPCEMLWIDCADHLKPSESHKEKRLEAANAFWEIKSIADERRIPIGATVQLSKEALNRIATSEHLSEAYDKARIASRVITLNQTRREATDDKMRWFLAKNRGGTGKIIIPLKVDLSRSHFEHAPEDDDDDDDDE